MVGIEEDVSAKLAGKPLLDVGGFGGRFCLVLHGGVVQGGVDGKDGVGSVGIGRGVVVRDGVQDRVRCLSPRVREDASLQSQPGLA